MTPSIFRSWSATASARSVRVSTSIGVRVPVVTWPFSSTWSVSYAAPVCASDAESADPILIPRNDTKSTPIATRAQISATQRRRTISLAQAVQPRLALFSCRIFGQSTRGPMLLRIAGVSVSVTSTEARGMSAPPIPTLRMNGTGSTTSASRPIATVRPLKSTACPAVSIAATTASWLSLP